MRRILQSKLGVSLLCGLAGICIAANFIHLPPRGRAERAVARGADPPGIAMPSPGPVVPGPLRCAAGLSPWRSLWPESEVRRDPFQYGGGDAPVASSHPPAPRTNLTLQALSIDGDRSYAVINRQVLAVGEWIGEYQVVRITPTRVELTSRWGEMVMSIDAQSRRSKGATETPVPADLRGGLPDPFGPGR